MESISCPRCCGRGHIPAFAAIADGVCFLCGGSGKVDSRSKKLDQFTPINAMHCATLAEAQSYRWSEFTRRFPDLISRVSDSDRRKIENGMGQFKSIVKAIQQTA